MRFPHTKRPFETKEDCDANIAANDIGIKLWSYLCEQCGKWHKTKHDPVEYAKHAGVVQLD